MLFQTPTFFLFFACLFALYWALQGTLRWQNRLLLAASYLFYAWWDVRFLILIVGGTAFAYVIAPAVAGQRITRRQLGEGLGLATAGALISFAPDLPRNLGALALTASLMAGTVALVAVLNRVPTNRRPKIALWAGIIANLSLLGFFKYFNFFADTLAQSLGALGWDLGWTAANIMLPIGISFFTFQKIAYLIDVRRGEFQPSHSVLTFASFVAYFPQLVAGPIERAPHLYGQFQKPRRITAHGLQSGSMLFLWGLYKKLIIADNLAPIVNNIFARADTATSAELAIGLIAFAFQIYGDFSGYTDMARGIARMMGFELVLNFRLPYFSRTPSEFWTRWHISLSSWLRDYLYVGLGGNRGGKLLTYRNLFLTMLLGGLWHGAAWTFVAWGAFHGVILILYRLADIDRRLMPRINGWMETHPVRGYAANLALWVPMMLLTLFGWLLFRAPDMASVGHYLTGLARFTGPGPWGTLAFYTMPLILIQCWQRHTGKLEFLAETKGFVRLNLILFLVCSILFLAPRETADFIYFAF